MAHTPYVPREGGRGDAAGGSHLPHGIRNSEDRLSARKHATLLVPPTLTVNADVPMGQVLQPVAPFMTLYVPTAQGVQEVAPGNDENWLWFAAPTHTKTRPDVVQQNETNEERNTQRRSPGWTHVAHGGAQLATESAWRAGLGSVGAGRTECTHGANGGLRWGNHTHSDKLHTSEPQTRRGTHWVTCSDERETQPGALFATRHLHPPSIWHT